VLVLVLPTACDCLFTQIAGLLAELAARHGIRSIQPVGMPPSSSSPPKKAVRTSISLHSKPRERSCSLSGCMSRLQARRIPIHSRCSRLFRRGKPPEELTVQLDAAALVSTPIWCRRCPARQRLAKVDSELAWETSMHETPVLLSILERVVDQLGTDEEPEPSTLSLTASRLRVGLRRSPVLECPTSAVLG